jgi:hypothetical protein
MAISLPYTTHQVIADVLKQRVTPPPSPRREDSAAELTEKGKRHEQTAR